MPDKHLLVKKYFDEHSFVESNILSFNNFVDKEIHKIIAEIGEVVPTIIPPEVQEFKIKFDKITIGKPSLTEADGSKRDIYPNEARLRKLSYSAPMFLNVSIHVDGVQRESFTTQIGRLPIMIGSKYCHLYNLKREELIKSGECPDDLGGYFILNGNERVLIIVEDLLPNTLFVQENKSGPCRYSAKLFSVMGPYKIPHLIEQTKDGMVYLSFTRFKRMPIIVLIKALGLTTDRDIVSAISDTQYDDVYINLYDALDIRTQEDTLEFIARKIKLTQPKDVRLQRVRDNLDRYLLPHIGITPKDRIAKAHNLCKLLNRFFLVSKEHYKPNDKDHYMNKQLQLSGDMLADLFRVNLKVLVDDVLYNFQRLVKRGKFQSVKIIIRDKLLTSRVLSAMATGSWIGGRRGISQNLDRVNNLATLSHLQRVVSLLSASQENFDARELHPTHWGRLCAIETPEGTSIGLRKNMAMLCNISHEDVNEDKLKKSLEIYGLKTIAK